MFFLERTYTLSMYALLKLLGSTLLGNILSNRVRSLVSLSLFHFGILCTLFYESITKDKMKIGGGNVVEYRDPRGGGGFVPGTG